MDIAARPTQKPTFAVFLVNILTKSFASWHGHEKWIACVTYVAIVLLPFLVTKLVSGRVTIVTEEIEYVAALIASMWLFVLVIVVAPFLLWRELTYENDDLKRRIDTRYARIAALKNLGAIWEDENARVNKLARAGAITMRDAERMADAEREIYRLIELISPAEVSTTKVLGNLDERDHPPQFHAANFGGDNTLIVYRTKLLKVQKFIDKHSPPASANA